MRDFLHHVFRSGFASPGPGQVGFAGVLWLNVFSDALITLAYFSIAATVVYFGMRRRDFPYRPGIFLFAGFLIICGGSRLFEVWTQWQGNSEWAGAAKALTALLSVATAAVLVKLLPGALKLRSPLELSRLNTRLEEEIAERKRVEVVLQNERHLLRVLMDNLPDRIFFKDRDGRYLRNNTAHLRQFGLKDQAQALGKTDADFFSREHARQTAEDEQMVMSTGFAIHKEEEIIWPGGRVDWALVTKLPLNNEDGEIIGTFGIARDINELKRVERELVRWKKELETRVNERTEELARTNAALEEAVRKHEVTEQALRHSEERIRQVVEATPSALVTVDSRGRMTLVNSQTERLFGYRREELLNQLVDLLVPERFRGQHSHLRAEYFKAAEARPMGAGRDLFGLRKDGTEVPVEIGLNPFRTAEGSFVLASIIDVTERQQTEQVMKDSLREKETLLKEVHHRVKNNLQIISSVLQLQAGYLRDPQALSAFRECQHRIRSMALIHEKLYQAGNFARINFAEYAQSLVSILVRSYNSPYCAVKLNHEIETVSLDLDTAIPFALILNEAVSNSLKHAFRGQPRGNIWVRLRQTDDGELILSVQDDGIGLADETETEHPSSLGLRLIRILGDQLHGTIEINRHPGTTITLSTRPEAGEKADNDN